jgi:trehalose 6-phosphate phosphatase
MRALYAAPPVAPGWAIFLDVDGTLLEIAESPEEVHATPAECRMLERLQKAAGGALALVSGRQLEVIDDLFSPLALPAAGQHGVERRDAQGRVQRDAFPAEALARAVTPIRAFAARHKGLVFENKGSSVALHYRRAPRLAAAAHSVVREAAAELGELVEVQRGKMVAELKPAGRDKGMAIEAFMEEPPFAGRIPVFVGDDLTDEYGFRVVNRLGGHSVKVGRGPTSARWRLQDSAAVHAWLEEWIALSD